MGKAIDLMAIDNPAMAALMDDLKEQMLIVLVKRLGGEVTIPCAEVDSTTQDVLQITVNQTTRDFSFKALKKQ